MTEPSNESPGPRDEPAALDLSLFSLPVSSDPGNAEVGLGCWPRQAAIKRRFWGTLAKRLDLTGLGSLVIDRPYGTGHGELIAASEARFERLLEAIARKEHVQVLTSDGETRPSQLHRRVATMIEEVTPQFFLRNIPRIERHAFVRRPRYQLAVWRVDESELIEAARKPYLEPVDFISELSAHLIKGLRAEAWQRVYGLDWENDVRDFKPAAFRPPVFASEEQRRIPIEELRDEPPRRGRETSAQRHARTMSELGKRFDASRDRKRGG